MTIDQDTINVIAELCDRGEPPTLPDLERELDVCHATALTVLWALVEAKRVRAMPHEPFTPFDSVRWMTDEPYVPREEPEFVKAEA